MKKHMNKGILELQKYYNIYYYLIIPALVAT